MAAQLAISGAGVECVEAAPGTGKTTALGVYVAACRRAGMPVVGSAPSARARDELRLGARIGDCYTVDKLLLELRRSPLRPGSVVILDEASMCGSRKLADLVDLASARRAKVVLVGDVKQLSSVDAGGGFRGLVARLEAHRPLENRRQVEQWERDALRDLREGRVRRALTAYGKYGRLHLGNREDLIEQMVDAWWAARERGESVMQAPSWRDVLELNRRARERLAVAGLVERQCFDVRGEMIGVGDQVLVLRNERRLGVINCTLGTVTAIDRRRGDIVIETAEAEPRTVCLPAGFWNLKGRRRLTLAYCRTIHKAQGATYRGESFTLAGDDTLNLEATHVALSRATVANHLYYSGEPPPDEDHHAADMKEAEVAGLVAAVGRSRAQVMALDLLQTPSAKGAPSRPDSWAEAPMTEAQASVLARKNALPPRALSWVEASLLIDGVMGAPRGERARLWLRDGGITDEMAAQVVDRADETVREVAEEATRGRARRHREAWAHRASPAGTPPSGAAEGPARRSGREGAR
jgi:AAA domain-containing protein